MAKGTSRVCQRFSLEFSIVGHTTCNSLPVDESRSLLIAHKRVPVDKHRSFARSGDDLPMRRVQISNTFVFQRKREKHTVAIRLISFDIATCSMIVDETTPCVRNALFHRDRSLNVNRVVN
jgi:hypothetical protein